MEALANAVTRYARDAHPDEPSLADCGSTEGIALQNAAETWAVFALGTYTGDNLTAALAVSRALCEFVHQLTQ